MEDIKKRLFEYFLCLLPSGRFAYILLAILHINIIQNADVVWWVLQMDCGYEFPATIEIK